MTHAVLFKPEKYMAARAYCITRNMDAADTVTLPLGNGLPLVLSKYRYESCKVEKRKRLANLRVKATIHDIVHCASSSTHNGSPKQVKSQVSDVYRKWHRQSIGREGQSPGYKR